MLPSPANSSYCHYCHKTPAQAGNINSVEYDVRWIVGLHAETEVAESQRTFQEHPCVGSNSGLRVELSHLNRDAAGHSLITSSWEGYILWKSRRRVFLGRSNELHICFSTELIDPPMKKLLSCEKPWICGCWSSNTLLFWSFDLGPFLYLSTWFL
ncbi:hypothetical protein VTI28DRAFT_5307 [Corynascus sepedonium]